MSLPHQRSALNAHACSSLPRTRSVIEETVDCPADLPYRYTRATVQCLTATGAVLGTPAYMAPEQALNAKEAGPLADVWVLDTVLYARLTGQPPFVGAGAMETLMLVIETELVGPRKINSGLPVELEAICTPKFAR